MTAPMSKALARILTDATAPHRRTRRLALICGIAVALGTIGLLALSGWFLTAAAVAGAAGPMAARAFNYLLPSAMIRLLAIIRTAARYGEKLLSHRAALSTLAGVRTSLFRKAAAGEAARTVRLSGGEAAALLVQDIDGLEDRLIRGPAMAGAISGAVLAVLLSALAGLVPAILLAALLAATAFASRRLADRLLPVRAHAAQQALADLKSSFAEYAACTAEIAVYGAQDRISGELEALAARHDRATQRQARTESAIAALTVAAAGFGTALVLACAGIGATGGGIALTAMAALAAAASAETLGGLVRAQIRAPAVDAAAARLSAIAAIEEAPMGRPLTGNHIRIVANAETAELTPGMRLAITGRSGSGKSRLLGTLTGLRADAPQQMAVDGRDVATLPLPALRPLFALMPQDSGLIAGSIADNLRLARPGVTEADMRAALDTACLLADIDALPDGLHTWIGDNGARLSGGQRKRLSLARALLADRPWLLLDEPSEGLDAATEAGLARRLGQWLERTGQGLLLTTHRPAMLALAQRRLRLDHAG